jgi:serine/threonine protein kinase
MRSILKCLKFCQEKGVMHRDLKFENLILQKDKDLHSIKLADFGFA